MKKVFRMINRLAVNLGVIRAVCILNLSRLLLLELLGSKKDLLMLHLNIISAAITITVNGSAAPSSETPVIVSSALAAEDVQAL